MIEEQIDIKTDDGLMPTFICQPERTDAPVVLMLMDAPGIREELREMARRVASVGYCVLLPNLYYRAGTNPTFGDQVLTSGSEDHRAMRAIRTKMTIPPVMKDVAAMIEFADAREGTRAGAPIGTHGYCMSGPYSLAAAAAFPDRITAAASFYGTWLVSDAEQSPHLTFGDVNAELYVSCAEFDDLAPPDMVVELKQHFESSGVKGELEIQPGVHHGFAFPARSIYDKPAAERHYERLFALYARNL